MSVPRKIDYDEAKRLRAEGLTYRAIAERFGVSTTAVARVVDPKTRARMDAARDRRQRSGHCPDCGAQTTRRASGSLRCRACAAQQAATTVRPNELRCATCKQWKPDEAFARSQHRSVAIRRGRHRECRSCNTRSRQDLRLRNRVPCANCGAPRLRMQDSGQGRWRDTGLCRSCYEESRRAA